MNSDRGGVHRARLPNTAGPESEQLIDDLAKAMDATPVILRKWIEALQNGLGRKDTDINLLKAKEEEYKKLDGILTRKLEVATTAIRWVAQTVHQGNHTEQPGTFRECPKNTCSHAKEVLEELDA